jgi:hypothetical protein
MIKRRLKVRLQELVNKMKHVEYELIEADSTTFIELQAKLYKLELEIQEIQYEIGDLV